MTHSLPLLYGVDMSTKACQGQIQDFFIGGGGGDAKDYVRAHTPRARSAKVLTACVHFNIKD